MSKGSRKFPKFRHAAGSDLPTLKSRLIAVVLILLIPASLFTIWTFTGGDPKREWALVTHVTDGDTIGVGRGWRYETVRLIGIDTPETVHPEKPVEFFGPEASEFTRGQLKGKTVHLELEPSTQYNNYGRLLAYVFLMDGTLFNVELIKQGYARVSAPSPFHRYKEFRLHEREARIAGTGGRRYTVFPVMPAVIGLRKKTGSTSI